MSSRFDRWLRRIAPWVLALGLTISPSMTPTLRAQEAEEAAGGGAGEGTGRPLDGYLGTLCLVMLALFIVGKSARR